MPKNIFALSSSAKSNPERIKSRENEPENVNPLGAAPEFLTPDQVFAWDWIVRTCIPGVLGEGDEVAVAMAAQLLNLSIKDEATGQDKSLLKGYLAMMGMVPTERTKLSVPKNKPKNKFDD